MVLIVGASDFDCLETLLRSDPVGVEWDSKTHWSSLWLRSLWVTEKYPARNSPVIPKFYLTCRYCKFWMVESVALNADYFLWMCHILFTKHVGLIPWGVTSSVPPLLTQLLLWGRGCSSGSAPSQSAVQVFGTRFPHTSETFTLLRLFAKLLRLIVSAYRYIATATLAIIAVYLEYLRHFLIDLHQTYRHSSVP